MIRDQIDRPYFLNLPCQILSHSSHSSMTRAAQLHGSGIMSLHATQSGRHGSVWFQVMKMKLSLMGNQDMQIRAG